MLNLPLKKYLTYPTIFTGTLLKKCILHAHNGIVYFNYRFSYKTE